MNYPDDDEPCEPKTTVTTDCVGCRGESGDTDVRLEPSMTQYHWDGKGENPNAPSLLCRPCAEEYREHWTEMWTEYHNAVGG